MSRSRLTDPSRIENQWGKPLGKQAARTPSGLYGYPKQIQSSCEASVRKLRKAALKIVKAAYQKDAKVADFLTTHAKRNKSVPAKVLLATLNEARPVFGKFGVEGGKTAGRGGRYGLYGYSSRTASLGVQACAQFREAAGHIASDLHRRKAAKYARITGFLKDHWKQGKCGYSRMLHASYPEEAMKLASAPKDGSGPRFTPSPSSVAGWLGDEMDKTAGAYLTVVPAYGRDYSSKAKVLADWNDGKDFKINDMSSRHDGSYINKQDAEAAGDLRAINIRYSQMRKVVVINL